MTDRQKPIGPAPTAGWAQRSDSLLESTILGSFTSLGYRLRARSWDEIDRTALEGRTIVMTGATSGIGRALARAFAESGASLRMIARNPDKATALTDDLIKSSGNDDISHYLADLSSVTAVQRVADELLSTEPAIHILINNAAVLPAERTLTAEGLELSYATNLVAPFVLTGTLIPRLVESRPARIINVVSGGMYTQGLVDDPSYANGPYRGSIAYARAKRGLMVLTRMWAEDLNGHGVTVNATHPGWVDTPGVKDSLPSFHRLMRPLLRNTEQGIDTILWLATSEAGGRESGKLWHDRAVRSAHRIRKTVESAADRRRLWSQLSQLQSTAPTTATQQPVRLNPGFGGTENALPGPQNATRVTSW